jgi:hypothetical protein
MSKDYPNRVCITKRRDQVRPGDVVRSSHGYDLLITQVDDSATNRTDDRHVGFVGHLHANPANDTRTERYSASGLVTVYVLDTSTPQGRWEAVAAIFEAHYGPLYADEEHTDPLWHMAEPSVDITLDGEEGDPVRAANLAGETAARVAHAIALLAYGAGAVATAR